MKTVLLVGATGVFGHRLAHHIAGFEGIRLVLTSRDMAKAEALCKTIIAKKPAANIKAFAFDKSDGFSMLQTVKPWLVIDASGPFQQADLLFPRAVLNAGAHYIDLADASGYLVSFAELNSEAESRQLVALAGASSTPALSSAVVEALTHGWQRIDTIDMVITPGGKSDVGPAVLQAILSYAGTNIDTFSGGKYSKILAWTQSRMCLIPGLGKRRVAAVETGDAALLQPKFNVQSRISFSAGLESPIEQWGLIILAHLRRLGLIKSLMPLAKLLLAARKVTQLFTSDRGAMLVDVAGVDGNGQAISAQWSLLAEKGDGPHVPTLAAAAALRALLAGQLQAGARACVGDLPLDAIEREMQPYAITTRR